MISTDVNKKKAMICLISRFLSKAIAGLDSDDGKSKRIAVY